MQQDNLTPARANTITQKQTEKRKQQQKTIKMDNSQTKSRTRLFVSVKTPPASRFVGAYVE